MNADILHELIDRYELNIDKIYNAEHNELFKWRVMKTWREERQCSMSLVISLTRPSCLRCARPFTPPHR